MERVKYKAVIFDFDDTLVKSRLAKWAQHKHVAKKFYNIDVKEEDLLKHWGKPFNILVGELYKHSDTLENMYKAVLSTKDHFPKKVYKESVNVIKQLLNKNIKVGVVSATTKEFLIEDLTKFGFPIGDFSIIQGADETLIHKPLPGVFLPMLSKLEKEGIRKNDIVYVGDSLDDLRASTEAGIDFIAVTTGLYSKKDFQENGAKTVIKEIQGVIAKLI